MKIVTLNTWGGRVNKELLHFLDQNQDIDVFCFQEIYHEAKNIHNKQDALDLNPDLFNEIKKALPNHVGYFRPNYMEVFGLATFIKNGLEITEEGEYYVHHHKGYIPEGAMGNQARSVQVVALKTKIGNLHIFNFHGLWNGGKKTDTEDRLRQSKKLVAYIKQFEGPKVLCGDFNLEPQTESLKLVEDLPMRNLIKEYNITSTRTSYYTKEIKFADYILVSNDVLVVDFMVLPDEVSDHSALKLEIETE